MSDDILGEQNALTWRAYERTLIARNRSKDTLETYVKVLRRLAARYPGVDLTELSQADLETYMGEMLALVSASTAALHYRHLRAMYNWCVFEEILDHSPMRRMKEPKSEDRPPPVIDDEHLRALLATCAGKTFEARRDTALIRLWCEPGSMRLAEMAGIRLEDLDMRRDLVQVTGKGNKTRLIPFGSKTGTALDRYLRMRAKHTFTSDPALWLGVKGAISPSGLAQVLKRRSRDTGMGHIHPHQMRHTSAHVWFDSDGSEGDSMELFGWSSPDMPRRYGRSAKTARAQRASRRLSPADRL